MRLAAQVVTLILCATAAWSADITGQWKAEWADYGASRGSFRQNTFTFQQDGTALTGTLKGEGGEITDSPGQGERRQCLVRGG